jgi:hypothetical protein
MANQDAGFANGSVEFFQGLNARSQDAVNVLTEFLTFLQCASRKKEKCTYG